MQMGTRDGRQTPPAAAERNTEKNYATVRAGVSAQYTVYPYTRIPVQGMRAGGRQYSTTSWYYNVIVHRRRRRRYTYIIRMRYTICSVRIAAVAHESFVAGQRVYVRPIHFVWGVYGVYFGVGPHRVVPTAATLTARPHPCTYTRAVQYIYRAARSSNDDGVTLRTPPSTAVVYARIRTARTQPR